MRVFFFSSGYWDVSLRQVVFIHLWIQCMMIRSSIESGFPIRRSPDQRLLATSPKLFAGCYVLHRLLMSRHPPFALNYLFNHKNCATIRRKWMMKILVYILLTTKLLLLIWIWFAYSIVKLLSDTNLRIIRIYEYYSQVCRFAFHS